MDAPPVDPRVQMAAERTFLAWIRTGVALMGLGFVVARFGLFLEEVAGPAPARTGPGAEVSLAVGLGLIALGVVVFIGSAWRHRLYLRAIEEDRFGAAFGSGFAMAVVALLAAGGVAMALLLLRL